MNQSLEKIIQQNVPLARYTTWQVGGPAKYFAEPKAEEIPDLFDWAHSRNLPIYIIGRGSNILISDEGLPGLVIVTRKSLDYISITKNHIETGAGTPMPRLAQFAAKEGWKGFGFMVGIPGTVGGGIRMNAGLTVFRPREMVSVVQDFDFLNTDGRLETLTMKDIHARYRETDLGSRPGIILRARFKLEESGDPDAIMKFTKEHLAERKRKQPLDKPTAGSTFKSPPGSKGAGWYIEQTGLKGFQIGGARVSPKHANWIENMGNARASDILELIEYIQNYAKAELGIILETEALYLQ
ncbi:MAG: UDP-N-acetylmuramate dehydrogenase [Opitutales bacterium]|nr:UDP-N-acetylmuramate dehydrogenase [Opitutales bacterium]